MEILTIAFAAPMVFYFPVELSEVVQAVMSRLFHSSVNWVYYEDICPRFAGHTDFWVPAAKDLAAQILQRAGDQITSLGRVMASRMGLLGEGQVELLFQSLLNKEAATLEALRRYRHTATLKVQISLTLLGTIKFTVVVFCGEVI